MKSFALVGLSLGFASALKGRATTTRFSNNSKGACGCGPKNADKPFSWQLGIGPGVYTAAGSPILFGEGTWCGSGCGKCYKLTSTGKAPPGQGPGGAEGQSIVVMLTNVCPNGPGEQWCPVAGQKNYFGYEYHFDILTEPGKKVFGDNPIVDFESVTCPTVAYKRISSCECSQK